MHSQNDVTLLIGRDLQGSKTCLLESVHMQFHFKRVGFDSQKIRKIT